MDLCLFLWKPCLWRIIEFGWLTNFLFPGLLFLTTLLKQFTFPCGIDTHCSFRKISFDLGKIKKHPLGKFGKFYMKSLPDLQNKEYLGKSKIQEHPEFSLKLLRKKFSMLYISNRHQRFKESSQQNSNSPIPHRNKNHAPVFSNMEQGNHIFSRMTSLNTSWLDI